MELSQVLFERLPTEIGLAFGPFVPELYAIFKLN